MADKSICLQNFLFLNEKINLESLTIDNPNNFIYQKNTNSIHGSNPNLNKSISFDGVINSFPVGYFSRFTKITHIFLKGRFQGLIGFKIYLKDKDGEHILFQESSKIMDGTWESPSIPILNLEGRIYLICEVKGEFSLDNLGWFGVFSYEYVPSFLISITIFNSSKFKTMLQDFCNYSPLLEFPISFLIVDNGQYFKEIDLPNDPRIILKAQKNLGAVGGTMRGIYTAKQLNTDYIVVIADDDVICLPEMLYRLIVFQSLTKKSISAGAMMMYTDRPNILHEQGAIFNFDSIRLLNSIDYEKNLALIGNIDTLYVDRPCDFIGSWMMSAQTNSLPFTPAFFIYFGDILQGYLLCEKGIRNIVPPHIIIWQEFGWDSKLLTFRFYDWVRNELVVRMLKQNYSSRRATIAWFLKPIISDLLSFDYERIKLFTRALEDVFHPSEWALAPENGHQRIIEIRQSIPQINDFSSHISKKYIPTKFRKRSRLRSIGQRILTYLTLAGYLNPFAKSVFKDGKYIYRFSNDNNFYQWWNYKKIVVIDSKGNGYLCERNIIQALGLVITIIILLFRYQLCLSRLKKEYFRESLDYEKIWNRVFQDIS